MVARGAGELSSVRVYGASWLGGTETKKRRSLQEEKSMGRIVGR